MRHWWPPSTRICRDRQRELGVKHLWSSGYDVRLTRERSPVRSWPGVLFAGGALLRSENITQARKFALKPKSFKQVALQLVQLVREDVALPVLFLFSNRHLWDSSPRGETPSA